MRSKAERFRMAADKIDSEVSRLRGVLAAFDEVAPDFEAGMAMARAIDTLRTAADFYRSAARKAGGRS